ncbi:related to pseudouridine synthase 3 [Cephalotrichum gorgonifer]|uniref:Related to pseudouridine synthase 3 n=1 Tax=Cephalotrichum gorgonifer TaxID=2041049 RepID=A0AAE8MQU1_9PEZI|nr:related to pseudouridine synthase 3 [Cephalotrichum gorgonifer]
MSLRSPRIWASSSLRTVIASPRSSPARKYLISRAASSVTKPETEAATESSPTNCGGAGKDARDKKRFNMADLTNKYQRWTRTDLLDRLQLLENELAKRNIDVDAELQAQKDRAEAEAAAKAEAEAEARAKALAQTGEGADQTPETKKRKKTKKRPVDIDPSQYSTRFIALKLAYLGKNYGGFEFQVSGEVPSIEEELWKALTTARLIYPADKKVIDFSCCDYAKCGRTDKGVSAFGQVVSLRVRSNRPRPREAAAEGVEEAGGEEGKKSKGGEEEAFDDVKDELRYVSLLNKLLPPDIRILAWCPSPPEGFSARFSCRERQYRYFFTQPSFLPLPSQYGQKGFNGLLDLEAMRAAAKMFVGTHDFRNFCKVDAAKQITNFEREIFDADIIEVPESDSMLPFLGSDAVVQPGDDGKGPKVYAFVVKGSAFLWHQIRCMISILFLVAQGHESPSIVSDMLDVKKNPSRTTYIMAHEVPLVLWDCVFPEEDPLRQDSLRWVYPSEESEGDYYGATAVLESAWTTWRERKMDEVLAAQLAARVAGGDPPERWPGVEDEAGAEGKKKKKARPVKLKVFEGGNNGRLVGNYVPVMKLKKMATPDEVNDLYAQKAGFASAEEMRATEGWRNILRDARMKKKREAVE